MTDEAMFSKDTATNNWHVIHSIFREIRKLKPSTTETNQQHQNYYVPSQFTNLWIFKSSFPPLTFTRTERTTAGRLNDQAYLASTWHQFNKQIKTSIFKSQTQVTCCQHRTILAPKVQNHEHEKQYNDVCQAILWQQHSLQKEMAK